jgi:hypothetical protein
LVIEQLDRSVLRHAPELARELQLGDRHRRQKGQEPSAAEARQRQSAS